MATKTKKATKKGNKPSVAKKVNASLINASMAAISTTIDNGEKWQKLASKLIKKSEKVREQQINMIFDTAEAVKGQVMVGADRMKDLVGIDDALVEKAKDMAINNPVSRKVVGIVEDITETVSENPMVQKAEKTAEDIKNMGIAKYNELKGDVLEQASKIIDRGEALIEEAKSTPKAKVTKKPVAKKTTAKKTVAKKVTATKAKAGKATKKVAKKATTTKAKATKVVSKAAPKKVVAKKTTKKVTKAAPKAKATVAKKTTAAKKVTVTKVAEVKKTATAKVAEVKK